MRVNIVFITPTPCYMKDVNGGMLCLALCELHPEYMPLNDWQHGCAIISIDEGKASVQNLRIKDGRVL